MSNDPKPYEAPEVEEIDMKGDLLATMPLVATNE